MAVSDKNTHAVVSARSSYCPISEGLALQSAKIKITQNGTSHCHNAFTF
jgi:hypothetical protein